MDATSTPRAPLPALAMLNVDRDTLYLGLSTEITHFIYVSFRNPLSYRHPRLYLESNYAAAARLEATEGIRGRGGCGAWRAALPRAACQLRVVALGATSGALVAPGGGL